MQCAASSPLQSARTPPPTFHHQGNFLHRKFFFGVVFRGSRIAKEEGKERHRSASRLPQDRCIRFAFLAVGGGGGPLQLGTGVCVKGVSHVVGMDRGSLGEGGKGRGVKRRDGQVWDGLIQRCPYVASHLPFPLKFMLFRCLISLCGEVKQPLQRLSDIISWQESHHQEARHVMSLFQSIGTFDNLDEPTPFMNNKNVIYGFVITFLVSRDPLRRQCRSSYADVREDDLDDMRHAAIICSLLCDALPRMG